MRSFPEQAEQSKLSKMSGWESVNQLKGVLKFCGLMAALFLALALSRELFLGITRGPDTS